MILEALQRAIANGEPIRVRYFGGSTPGQERLLSPITVKDGKVRALCSLSDTIKTFVIDKMELANRPSTLAARSRPPQTYNTLDEFVSQNSELLENLGWIAAHEEDRFSLYRTYKNGKPIKTPELAIYFVQSTYDLIFDGENVVEMNHRDRSRPWVVSAKKHTSTAYKDFGKAQLAFLELAKDKAPNMAPP